MLDGRAFQRNPLPFLLRLEKAADVVHFKTGFSGFDLVRCPELIQRILVKENDLYGEGKWTLRGRYIMKDCLITREGNAHRERRSQMRSPFGRQAVEASSGFMVDRAIRFCKDWRDGSRIDLFPDMGRLALEIACESLFEIDLHGRSARLNEALLELLVAIPRLPIPQPRVISARRHARRMAGEFTRGDLVRGLREAGLSSEAIRDEIIALMIASIDTTPKTLCWLFAMIGMHPEVESAVLAEFDEVLGERDPTVEDIRNLPRFDRVLDETLRLFPPVHFIDRRPLEDVRLNGTLVKAGSYMLLCPLYTQRDERYFEDPHRFDDSRWTADEVKKRPVFSFFPFGAGAHACIGRRLATVEMKLIAATVLRRWRIRPEAELVGDPNPQRMSFPCRLERRA
jgi:cytochrome P450